MLSGHFSWYYFIIGHDTHQEPWSIGQFHNCTRTTISFILLSVKQVKKTTAQSRGDTGSAQNTLRKRDVRCDWQRHYSILAVLSFRDYNDVTLIPLHGWTLKNYRGTNNSTSRVHILQVLRYPLSLLQLIQQPFLYLMTRNFIFLSFPSGDYSYIKLSAAVGTSLNSPS